MKHANQAALALYAGGDLGWIARWRVQRHLLKCEECGEEVASFEAMREVITDLSEIPDVPWHRLAAGECVRPGEPPLRDRPVFTGLRAVVALASILMLSVTGLVLESPTPLKADNHTVVRGIHDGIEVGGGGGAFRLMNTGAKSVT